MIEMLERGGDFLAGRIRDREYIEGVDMNSSEGDSGFNHSTGNKNNRSHENIQYFDELSKRPQFRDSTVCWERFLPLRSLKVLLVENDDSTRHLVRSLLQNCSYEVSAVSNGMQAWKILEDSTNHIDIVLTEVVMPLLNGVGLLSKIVNHNILNNIPVIMMSSHDSMDVVFKCLSNGAVDFLVKPIRKNELKNLWQHVWRKCHSSSGSGSETGTQIKTSKGIKSTVCLENNTGSNDEHENGSTEPVIRPSSDNGSGTQNSCTRKSTGTKSHDTESPRNQFSDALDMTYARIFQTELGIMNTPRGGAKGPKKYHEMDSKYVDLSMGKDLQIQMPMRSETPCQLHREDIFLQRNNDNELPNLQSKLFYIPKKGDTSENFNFRLHGDTLNRSIPKHNCTETVVLNGTITPPTEDISLNTKTTNTKYREMPSVDLNFKKQGGVADVDASVSDEQNILRHSNLSAFSKYRNESSSLNQVPNGNTSSRFLVNSPTMPTFLPHSESTPRLYSEGHGDVNDENLTALSASHNSNEKSVPLSTLRYFDQNFQTPHNDDPCQSENHISGKTDNWRIKTIPPDPMSSGLHVQIQHHHHHYHHHVRNLQTHKRGECHDLEDHLNNMNSGALQSGSSHVFSGPVQSNATNYSLNGSASGSNHGSNDHGSRVPNLGNNALNTEMPNLEINDMITGNIHRERLDETHENDCGLRQRESVLTMFFQNEKGADKIEDEDKNGSCTKNMESNAQQGGASNVIGIPFERNSAKCSMNGSISKTSHGSIGQTISSSILNHGIPQLEYKNMISENSGGTLNGKNNGNGGEDDRFSQREAALIKFRQKRKDRCFEKKVRYQSRKKLADLRPRVRGQFVRQARRGDDMGECSSSV